MKLWNKQSIQQLLETNDKAVRRAVLAIYARQTDDEKSSGTKYQNCTGFGAFDSLTFSRMAQGILAGGRWTPRIASFAREKGIGKYWKQLAEIANEREQEKENAHRKLELSDKAPGTTEQICSAWGNRGSQHV